MGPRRLSGWNWLAFGWGISEAVIFFVVPDVLLTFIAVRYGLRRGIQAVVWALFGAVIGGWLAFAWGSWSPETADRWMAMLPAIDREMITTVNEQMTADGPRTLVTAPLHGRPYKLYAAAAGDIGTSPIVLALWTIPSRLWRFLGLTVLFGSLEEIRRRWVSSIPNWPFLTLWALFWLIVYVKFWSG